MVCEDAVEDDVRALRSMLALELGLDRPDKNPEQFRYAADAEVTYLVEYTVENLMHLTS